MKNIREASEPYGTEAIPFTAYNSHTDWASDTGPYVRGATGKSCALRSLRCIYDPGASAPCYAPPSRTPRPFRERPRHHAQQGMGRRLGAAMARGAPGRGRGTRSRLSGCMGCRRKDGPWVARVWAFPSIRPRRVRHTQRPTTPSPADCILWRRSRWPEMGKPRTGRGDPGAGWAGFYLGSEISSP